MRGKVETHDKKYWWQRITPAYAGKSNQWLMLHTKRMGSPPPMRGKGLRETVYQIGDGITPAYAGKSFKPCIPSCTK